jgi:hydroxyethylthiazole kinase-like uncharacterized protein yjeF
MDELLSCAEMRAAEAEAIAAGATTGAAMMARAGEAVAAAAMACFGSGRAPGRVAVLCGPGNNGGDGYVVAAAMARAGWDVAVFALGDPARAPADAAAARADWVRIGAVRPFAALADAGPADLAVDALFGTGAARPLGPEVLHPWAAWRCDAPIVAVDGPSGLNLDTGRPMGAVRRAALTVTFHRARPGHHLAEGPAHCGRLLVADIGIEGFGRGARRLGRADPAALSKDPAGHKYSHGHAVVLAGGVGRGGAARLAARAALRVGAGLVTVLAPGAALIENAARLDAVMLRRCDGPDDLAGLLADARLNAVVAGPGLGVGARTRDMALAALAAGRGVVLDADALTSFAEDAPALFAACDPGRVILTPHGGEFARLFPDLADAAARGDRAAAAEAAAARAGATVLLKGPDTIVASPGARTAICAATYENAAPWLATAGSGDVLAGLAGGLLARGMAAPAAAETAAALHQALGRTLGPGLIAEDLPEAVPAALRAIGAR